MKTEFGAVIRGTIAAVGHREIGVTVELTYLPRRTPLSIHAGFRSDAGKDEPVIWWEFDRDLLRDGLIETAGHGDVQIAPDGHGRVQIRLRSNDGEATASLPAAAVRCFVMRCDRAVRPGTEDLSAYWTPKLRAVTG